MKSKLILGLTALVLVAPAFANKHEAKGHCMAAGKVVEAKDEAACTAVEGQTWEAGPHKDSHGKKAKKAHPETAAPAAK